jgi:methionyl aminopeptidase
VARRATIYTPREIEDLAQGGKILAEVLDVVSKAVKPGVTTKDLDVLAEKLLRNKGAEPAFLGYSTGPEKPYPASLCVSINDEIVHCIPSKDRILHEGDIVSLDLGAKYQRLITDMALTVPVGNIDKKTQKLLETTKGSLEQGLQMLRPGIMTGDLGHAIQKFGEDQGFVVIYDLVGHGVGHTVHEPPQIPNYGKPGTGTKLETGMVLAIEPMFSESTHRIKILQDGWGITTDDSSLSAHFEKTAAITDSGYRILTKK